MCFSHENSFGTLWSFPTAALGDVERAFSVLEAEPIWAW